MDHGDKVQAFQPLNAIGDEAYLAPMGTAVFMRQGDVMVNINMGTAENQGEAARKIASAVGRL
jgi:hypothetical protein